MMEIWKDIKGYEGLYQVSNLGRVKSLERIVNFGNQQRIVKEKILSPRDNGNGYKTVCLQSKYFYIHRLVAQTFIPNPDNKPQVDHIDTNKSNNCVDNLRWATHSENMNNPATKTKRTKSDEEKRERRKRYAQREDVKLRERERVKKDRKLNPEKYREMDREHYLRHREHRLAYQKEYAKRKRAA